MLKNRRVENTLRVCSEVIATATTAATTATAMTVAGATVAMTATGIADANKLSRKTAVAILATAVTTSAITTAVAVKRLGFFKKSNQPKANDIDREQIEDYSK